MRQFFSNFAPKLVCKGKLFIWNTQIFMQKNEIFNDFVSNLRTKHLKKVRNDILNRCGVSTMTYSKWVRGKNIPRRNNRIIINMIANSYGYGNVYWEESSLTILVMFINERILLWTFFKIITQWIGETPRTLSRSAWHSSGGIGPPFIKS